MRQFFKKLLTDETGAVTVDWVVLTAGIVALNVVVLLGLIEGGINQAASQIYDNMSQAIGFIN